MLPSTGQHACLLPTLSLCIPSTPVRARSAPVATRSSHSVPPSLIHFILFTTPAAASAAIHCTSFPYAAAPCALSCGLSKPAGSPAACLPAGCLCRPLCSHAGCLCALHPRRLPTRCLANNRQPACTCHAPHLLTSPHTGTPPSRFDSAPLIACSGLLLIFLLAPALYHPPPCPVPTIFPRLGLIRSSGLPAAAACDTTPLPAGAPGVNRITQSRVRGPTHGGVQSQLYTKPTGKGINAGIGQSRTN